MLVASHVRAIPRGQRVQDVTCIQDSVNAGQGSAEGHVTSAPRGSMISPIWGVEVRSQYLYKKIIEIQQIECLKSVIIVMICFTPPIIQRK